jgi:Chlorophyll A-B binding protein
MKSIIAASLIAGAAAFAPAQQSARTSVATNMAFENALGAQPPLGFFDPLGLVADGDQAKFDRLRYVEIKHGRICMLGVVGYLTNKAGIYLPGDIDYSGTKFSDLGSGWKASFDCPLYGALQVGLFIAFLELGIMKDVKGTGEFPGDFRNGFIDFGWNSLSPSKQLEKRAIELNQGRAAQMGMLGLMVHDALGNVDNFFPSV